MAATHTIWIPRWHPTRLNLLLGHWAKAARLKKADRDLVAAYMLKSGVPAATGRRRLEVTIKLQPKQRAGDPDCYFKSLLDALVAAGLLADDNRQNVQLEYPQFVRGTQSDWGTTITLTDIERKAAA